jgi:hypothetical protein
MLNAKLKPNLLSVVILSVANIPNMVSVIMMSVMAPTQL